MSKKNKIRSRSRANYKKIINKEFNYSDRGERWEFIIRNDIKDFKTVLSLTEVEYWEMFEAYNIVNKKINKETEKFEK